MKSYLRYHRYSNFVAVKKDKEDAMRRAEEYLAKAAREAQ